MSDPLVNTAADVVASADLALAIAEALGLPGRGRLVRLSIDFTANQPATVKAEFYGEPAKLADVLAGVCQAGKYKLVAIDLAIPQTAAAIAEPAAEEQRRAA